ncbi:MAG: DUF4332 domain-containing protein [Thiotrichaceae bacterium]
MTYLLAQLWLCLLIAGLIGSVLGWLLRGGCKRYSKAIEEMQIRYFDLEKENNRNKKKSEAFSKLSYQNNSLLAEARQLNSLKQQNKKLSVQFVKMQQGIKKARSVYEHTNQRLRKTQEILSFAKQSNDAKDASIQQIKKDAIIADNLLLKYRAEWKNKYAGLQENKESIKAKLAEKDSELNVLRLKLNDEEGEKNAFGDVQVKLAEAEIKLTDKESILDSVTVQINELKEEKNNAMNQLDLFKEQSQEYITKITEENAKYKIGVDLLEGDIQQWREQHDKRESELEHANIALQEKEQEVIALKEQLDNQPMQVAEELDNKVLVANALQEKEPINRYVVPKMNLLSRSVKPTYQSESENGREYLEKTTKKMSSPISVIHDVEVLYGVGKAYVERLAEQGISTTEDLLLYLQEGNRQEKNLQEDNNQDIGDAGGIDEVRVSKEDLEKKLAMVINVDAAEIKSWAVMADLLRLEGVSNEYAKALDLSGIHSVDELANSRVSKVSKKMTETMQKERRIKKVPDDEEILTWITQSRHLQPVQVLRKSKSEAARSTQFHISNLSRPSQLTRWRRVKKFVKMHRRK